MAVNCVGFGQSANVRPYGYDPKKGEFTPEQAKKDFKPGIYDPEAREKVEQRKKNIKKAILVTAGLVIAAGTVWFFTKGKGVEKLKKLWNTIKGKFSKTEEVVEKVKKTKVKTQKANIAEHADLLPGQKVKMGGKEAAHKVRRNKKAIIEATRLREQAEAITEKELVEYGKKFGYHAPTAEQAAIIAEKHSKPAVSTMADFMEKQGVERTKEGVKVVLKQKAVQPATVVEKAAEVVVDNAAKIAELEAKIAKQEAAIAKYSANPAMAKFAKPYEAAKAKLLQQLEQLKAAA